LLRNNSSNYGAISKSLHWLVALGMIGLAVLGLWMVELSYYDRWYNATLSLHRSIGMVVFGLAIGMFLWKIVSPSPQYQPELRRWECLAANSVSIALLISMLVLPISGYLISTSAGSGFPFFDFGLVPAVFPVSESLRDFAEKTHMIAGYAMILLAIIHGGAALKHQFLDGIGTLKRML